MTSNPRPVSRAIVVLMFVLGSLLASSTASAEGPATPPAIRLYGADLDEIRQLVLDSAAHRGWSIVSIEPDGATLEQTLETQAPVLGLDRPADILVRVEAEFIPDGADIVVRVQATQIDSPGSTAERTTDVTDRYRANLMNALRSLQTRWASRATVPDPPAAPEPTSTAGQPRLGTWAYYAERYAERQGCELGDEGAVLVSAGVDTEVHRVTCRGGRTVLVRCRYGDCTAAH